ncbi:MAG: LytR C-terminal domain-containing protein, partial [bacterium]|nr:LytR C-terminal domain-containing protein [bacterium]
ATNSLIYNIARDAAESFGWSVSAIVPAAFFGVTTADISISVLSQITKAKFSFGQSDFLREGVHGKVTVNPVVELNKSKSVSSITSLSQPSSNITAVSSIASISNSSNKKSILLLVLALIFFGFAGFIVKQYYFPAQVVKKVEAPVPAKEEEVIEVPVVETPAVEEVPSIDRSIFKIRVLNSTSIKGLASKVQKAFITAGFTIATAGNSTDVLTSTEVALYRKVSKADEDEIRSILVEALGVNDINFVNYFDEEKGSGYTYGTVNDDAVVTIAGVK